MSACSLASTVGRLVRAVCLVAVLLGCVEIAAACSSGRGAGQVVPTQADCRSGASPAAFLSTVPTSSVTLSGHPFDVVTSPDGHWSFVSLDSSIGVFSDQSFVPRLVGEIPVPTHPFGETLSHDGRYLVVADGSGAVVLSVAAAERRDANALVGVLGTPAPGGGADAVEVALSLDDRYAFVTRETTDDLAVFNLHNALLGGFGSRDFVGRVPLAAAPAGLAAAPTGRWLYAISESRTVSAGSGTGGGRRIRPTAGAGILSVLDVARAESQPDDAVVATVPAGSDPVRVVATADARTVWVTARGSDSLLGFSASKLLSDPRHALIAKVKVGPAPVGLTLFNHDTRIVVANSNRFSEAGACGSLSVIDTTAALRGRPASLGVIRAGGFPRQMVLEPGGRVLLVTDYSSAQLQAVDLSRAP